MSFCARFHLRLLLRLCCVALLAVFSLPSTGLAQALPSGIAGPSMSRFDIFAGYSYYSPLTQFSEINGVPYQSIGSGAVGSVSYYFNRFFGLQVEGSYFPEAPDDNDCLHTAQGGPAFRIPRGRLVPFAHAVAGMVQQGGPQNQKCGPIGVGFTTGLGVDYILPYFNNRFSVRPIQADFAYSKINDGPTTTPGTGGLGEAFALRFSAGIVAHFGDTDRKAVKELAMGCSADPTQVFSGDPVVVSAKVENLKIKKPVRYIWGSNGGHITGSEATETVDTNGLEPGTYTVAGHLVLADKGTQIAECTTSFVVQPFLPPTISCSANRAAINSGDTVMITAVATSPSNRPLTYSFSTSNGAVAGNGPNATLTTVGVSPGTIQVTCTATDDKGSSASALASVVVAQPPPPPVIAAKVELQPLCTITFDRDKRRPDRVDNEGKACLDDVALTLNRDPAARLLLVGNYTSAETKNDGAERALNAAQYLAKEKGVDMSRIDLRINLSTAKAVTSSLVPNGASIDPGSAAGFDPGSVKRHGQAYGTAKDATAKRARRHRRRRAPTAPPR